MPQTTEILPNGLSLLQDDRFFKLGQDSVLLSAFAKIRRRARVDLGCGTGALRCLLARGPHRDRSGDTAGRARPVPPLDRATARKRHSAARRPAPYAHAPAPTTHGLRHLQSRLTSAGTPARRPSAAPPGRTLCTVERSRSQSFVLHRRQGRPLCSVPNGCGCCSSEALSRVRRPQAPQHRPTEIPLAVPSAVVGNVAKGGSAETLGVEPPLLVGKREYLKIYGKTGSSD